MRAAGKSVSLFISAGLFLLVAGCETKKLYYYGDYSGSLYKWKKTPTPENRAKHEESLRDVIEKSKKKSLKVPPGIYCEYAFLLFEDGKPAEADEYFNLEVTEYPESLKFVAFVRDQLKKPKPP